MVRTVAQFAIGCAPGNKSPRGNGSLSYLRDITQGLNLLLSTRWLGYDRGPVVEIYDRVSGPFRVRRSELGKIALGRE